MATCDLAFGTQLSRTCFTDGHTVSCPTQMLCLLLEHVACLKGGPKCCRLVSKPKTKMKKRLSHYRQRDPQRWKKSAAAVPFRARQFLRKYIMSRRMKTILVPFMPPDLAWLLDIWHFPVTASNSDEISVSTCWRCKCALCIFMYFEGVSAGAWQGSVTGPFLRVLLH